MAKGEACKAWLKVRSGYTVGEACEEWLKVRRLRHG